MSKDQTIDLQATEYQDNTLAWHSIVYWGNSCRSILVFLLENSTWLAEKSDIKVLVLILVLLCIQVPQYPVGMIR